MSHPTQLGKYPITAVIGEGAMGVVYRAFDPDIGRTVALKTVRRELLVDDVGSLPYDASDGMAARFRNEARAVGRITHPGIVAIYEYGEDAGTAYIAMEYVEGRTLSELLAESPPLPEPELLRVMDQLLDALGHAHEAGVWHRDIKPANLIVTASGRIKVTDFGIARIENAGLTLVNAQIGTPGYMAPEQYSGEGVDQRADLYAAGVLLYRMVTGRKPFEGAAASVMFKVMTTDPVPPSQVEGHGRGAAYDAILARALARAPADRYASAAEFRRALAARRAAISEEMAGTMDLPSLIQRLPAAPPDGATLRPGVPGAAAPAPLRDATGARGLSTGAASSASAASSGLPPPGWSVEQLVPVEKALATVVGPMAKVLVRQAARQTTDLATLVQALATPLSEAERARFAARLEGGTTATALTRSATTATRTTLGSAAGGPGGAPAAGPPVDEALKAHAVRVLSAQLGPIARVLVKKAAEPARDAADFTERLLALADGIDRDRLRRELGGPR
ncbi:protein kinase domain-containing protein [Piscinibacter sakaiensis]|uniref:non-specific serine/threonine protein kinase n=1 Tax=Piscinibacter sakaiensis TaxID=1547922 RepID=A0A0K8NX96_PISS1|nr:serine/threonine-protein kinase [Piscinibacter sakaiensis]GAP35022.1 serine/threonine-protein kinase PknB [Piscinibacter sakaiensis]